MRPSFFTLSILLSSPALAENPFANLPVPIASTAFTDASCEKLLGEALQSPLGLAPKVVARADLSAAIQSLWTARLALRDRISELHSAGTISEGCVKNARRFLTAARSLEDALGERLVRPASFDKKNPRPALTGGFPHVLLNPAFGSAALKSGDVLASRGVAYTSAAISRVSDDPGQFSHVSLLYIDPRTGEKLVLQSLIEKGVVITPYDKYVRDGKGRLAVFRHPDARLAARAAEQLFATVSRLEASGRHLPYDFNVDFRDHSALFCSELVAWAFELAGKETRVPLFPSHISRRNRDFLNDTGLNARTIFLPADMDVDARFTLVAEWRDLSQVTALRRHDAILDAEFDWMERLDYAYSQEATMKFLRSFIRGLRSSPLGGLISEFVPNDMPKRTLGAVVNLFLASGPLNRELEKADQAALERTGYRLTGRELRKMLEKLRAEDHEKFRQVRQWREFDRFNGEGNQAPTALFHDYLRPRSEL